MLKRLAVLGLFIIALISCNNNTEYKTFLHDPILFSKTVHELNTVVMGNNFPPMVASRNYAYAAIAAYEVMAANNTTKYHSLGGQLNGLPEIKLPTTSEDTDWNLAAR